MKNRLILILTAALLGVALITSPVAARGNLGTVTAGALSGITATFGSGGEVTLNSSGISFAAGNAANNSVKWTDGSKIFSESGGHLTIDAAPSDNGVLIRADDDLVLEAGLDGSGVITLSGSAPPRISHFSALGTGRFVCHDNSGNLYDSGSTCDGSAPLLANQQQKATDRIVALEQEVTELRALVQQLASER